MRIGACRFRVAQSFLDQSRMGCCLYTDSFMLNALAETALAEADTLSRWRASRFRNESGRPVPSSAASGSERMHAALLICLLNITIITLLFLSSLIFQAD
ncbi:hypothetical protein QQF64_008243 [Cirrhinus molitorella]|uniref:Uncharacterized protein n=1 Tax=Cirrhinus molitorella TaxID=172907 RepID=A0ABR3M7Y9_9TELE